LFDGPRHAGQSDPSRAAPVATVKTDVKLRNARIEDPPIPTDYDRRRRFA
jgi:hypothetical protein